MITERLLRKNDRTKYLQHKHDPLDYVHVRSDPSASVGQHKLLRRYRYGLYAHTLCRGYDGYIPILLRLVLTMCPFPLISVMAYMPIIR